VDTPLEGDYIAEETEHFSSGKVATVRFSGTLTESNKLFEQSTTEQPLVFLVGAGQMLPAFENKMQGATVGEVRKFTLEPAQAFGVRNDEQVLLLERDNFPADMEFNVGDVLLAELPHGEQPFNVVSISEEGIMADFNHPLSGQQVTFEVELLESRDATEDELNHGHAHGPGGHHHH
jgi:FKBP-type peptidyl-prolyl cis-trans isomerase SlyD